MQSYNMYYCLDAAKFRTTWIVYTRNNNKTVTKLFIFY